MTVFPFEPDFQSLFPQHSKVWLKLPEKAVLFLVLCAESTLISSCGNGLCALCTSTLNYFLASTDELDTYTVSVSTQTHGQLFISEHIWREQSINWVLFKTMSFNSQFSKDLIQTAFQLLALLMSFQGFHSIWSSAEQVCDWTTSCTTSSIVPPYIWSLDLC